MDAVTTIPLKTRSADSKGTESIRSSHRDTLTQRYAFYCEMTS